MSHDVDAPGPPLLLRAFANRKHTSLTATLVLDAVLTALWFWPLVAERSWAPAGLADAPAAEQGLWAAFGLANAVLYPFSREIYHRATSFVPRVIAWGGGPLWMTFSLLLLVLRIAALIYTWLFAIPVGLIGAVILTLQERAGRGYRIIS